MNICSNCNTEIGDRTGHVCGEQSVTSSGNSDLLPCPFCGGDARLEKQYANGELIKWVQCIDRECGASAQPDAWNRRYSEVRLVPLDIND